MVIGRSQPEAAADDLDQIQLDLATKGDMDQLACRQHAAATPLAEWARRKRRLCPADILGNYIEQIDGPRLAADFALVVWLIEKGPGHFGMDWYLESALLEELQITGFAARLIAKAAQPMMLRKAYYGGTHRVLPPEVTLARIEPHLSTIGVTRCADVTGLDLLGIPVFCAIRPQGKMI